MKRTSPEPALGLLGPSVLLSWRALTGTGPRSVVWTAVRPQSECSSFRDQECVFLLTRAPKMEESPLEQHREEKGRGHVPATPLL